MLLHFEVLHKQIGIYTIIFFNIRSRFWLFLCIEKIIFVKAFNFKLLFSRCFICYLLFGRPQIVGKEGKGEKEE